MDGGAKYTALQQAVDNLVKYSRDLDTPINNFQSQIMGFQDSYSGTASDAVQPVLQKIKKDIEQLQIECANFAKVVKQDLENYMRADQDAQAAINSVIGN